MIEILPVTNVEIITQLLPKIRVLREELGVPIVYLIWNEKTGNLERHYAKITKTKNSQGEKELIWEESNEIDILTGPNKNNFEIFQDPVSKKFLVLDKQDNSLKELEDYIKEKGGSRNKDFYLHMMLPPYTTPKGFVREFCLYYDEKENKFFFPKKEEIFTHNDLAKTLINCFNFDFQNINEEIAKQEFQKFWEIATPKQRADFLAIFALPLINILIQTFGIATNKTYVLSYGPTKTGKTWVHKFAMKYFWGFDFVKNNTLDGDAINSEFRLSALLASTNLPVYIDESSSLDNSIIAKIKASAMQSVSPRGSGSQKINIYPAKATICTTAQHNIFYTASLSDELALERRFYINYHYARFEKDRAKYDLILSNLQTSGFALNLLLKSNPLELKNLFLSLYEKTNDLIVTGILLASKLLNLSQEQLDQIEIESIEIPPQKQIVYWIYKDAERVNDNDAKAKDLQGTIEIKEKEDFKYVAINTNYISYINSTQHPLRGKFKSLADLNQLQDAFSKEEIAKLPDGNIYDRKKVVRFESRDLKPMASATIPYTYTDEEKVFGLTEKIKEFYAEIFANKEPTEKSDENYNSVIQPSNITQLYSDENYNSVISNAQKDNLLEKAEKKKKLLEWLKKLPTFKKDSVSEKQILSNIINLSVEEIDQLLQELLESGDIMFGPDGRIILTTS